MTTENTTTEGTAPVNVMNRPMAACSKFAARYLDGVPSDHINSLTSYTFESNCLLVLTPETVEIIDDLKKEGEKPRALSCFTDVKVSVGHSHLPVVNFLLDGVKFELRFVIR